MGDIILTRRFSFEKEKFYLLTIDSTKIDSTLTNFPIMVKANSTNYNMSLLTDDNVYFTDDSNNLLDFEIEYATTSERIYHVKIPTISSSSNTTFKLKYNGSGYTNGNNPTSTWSNGYVFVSHMGDNLKDSTSYNHSISNSGTFAIDGQLTRARRWDGNSSDRLSITHNNVFNLSSNNFTISYKINRKSGGDSSLPVVSKTLQSSQYESGPLVEYTGDTLPNDADAYLGNGSTWTYGGEFMYNVPNNEWQYRGLRRNGSTISSHQNTSIGSMASYSGSIYSNTSPVLIGNWNFGQGFVRRLAMDLEEFRWSNVYRDNAWVKAEYYSLFNTLISDVSSG